MVGFIATQSLLLQFIQTPRMMISTRAQLVAVIAVLLLAISSPAILRAQEDAGDAPLGDVARNLRKKKPAEEVIDNDNLTKVMDDADRRRPGPASLKYSIDGQGKNFQVASPDVTCSLSFSANARALLSSQYSQVDLPPNDLLKLDGPAIIDGNSLRVSIFNGTDWHVSELVVALTLLKRGDEQETASYFGAARLVTAASSKANDVPGSEPGKKSDVTVVYRMRAGAAPSSTTVFTAPLNVEISPDQEWHWAIVQAKGYPPQVAPGNQSPTSP